MDVQRVEALLRELDQQRESYLRVHELLTQTLAASLPQKKNDAEVDSQRVAIAAFPASSNSREDSDDEGDDEGLYVQTPLESQVCGLEDLRAHLRSHKWEPAARQILDGVVGNPARLSQSPLIPNRRGPLEDRSDHTHCQVFDVGSDGSPLAVEFTHVERESGRAMAVWHSIREINPPSKQRHAVGRITILREPSPILFGALHYTMNGIFDVDELLHHLHTTDLSAANVHRVFEDDPRRQRSIVFNFEYFTLIGKDCQPMRWQLAAGQEDRKPGYIQITRCSSVVALSLQGDKIKDVRNPSRHRRKEKGAIFDPFSPWHVLNVQCYPDFKASLDVHDSTKHYVNGPEAFMTTLLSEFRDAHRRFADITRRISRRVRPPLEFMFDSTIRDALLFEDDEYSMAKRYFWAHQTLGIMNESIKALLEAYEENFPAEVWEGAHATLWPLLERDSARSAHYRRKMGILKQDFTAVLASLRALVSENEARGKEIQDLREDLFTGTSIQESRRSVTATETTVQQGHNIKLLTLVSIFFLPLTFVTGVFGMSNMPQQGYFWMFAIVVATVCVPFFILIGSLNSRRGLKFWQRRMRASFHAAKAFVQWLSGWSGGEGEGESEEKGEAGPGLLRRRTSTVGNREERKVEEPGSRDGEVVERRLEGGFGGVVASRVSSEAVEGKSRIADLWLGERERGRRLRYSEDV